jgi:hypothetical protein
VAVQDADVAVVDDVEDFHAAAGREVPVGDVGLPALVGQLGAEAFPGGAGPFVRLGCDETTTHVLPVSGPHSIAEVLFTVDLRA